MMMMMIFNAADDDTGDGDTCISDSGDVDDVQLLQYMYMYTL